MIMKKQLFAFFFTVGLMFASCDEYNDIPNGYIETTQENATTLVLKGYESSIQGFSVFQPDGFDAPFYIMNKQFVGNMYEFASASESRLDEMTGMPSNLSWQKNADIVAGRTYWVKYASYLEYKYVKMRVADISGNNVSVEYVLGDTQNRNQNANLGYDKTSVTNFEIPALNVANHYVDHYATYAGTDVFNYALEWDASKNHAAWVAFSFDDVTCKDLVSRTDAWDVDPELPTEMQTSNDNHKNDGFDRGHLCASEDRVYSLDANQQTFYFSNMSPQLASFNQGYWQALEKVIQNWGRSIPNVYDKVYVTKGASLDQLMVNFTGEKKGGDGLYPTTDENGFTKGNLACPKYYFMAILSEKGDTYHAIGFWVEHSENLPEKPTVEELQAYVLSIDELEQKTGIDFFCNLPDDVESPVEESYNLIDWAW